MDGQSPEIPISQPKQKVKEKIKEIRHAVRKKATPLLIATSLATSPIPAAHVLHSLKDKPAMAQTTEGSFNPSENQQLKTNLIAEMNNILKETDLDKMHAKESALATKYLYNPFSLRYILPSVMHRDVRKHILNALEKYRMDPGISTKHINKKEVLDYQKVHKRLDAHEIKFCDSRGISYEMYGSIKEIWPTIKKIMNDNGFDDSQYLNIGGLAELMRIETGNGENIGQGPAEKQWKPRFIKADRYYEEFPKALSAIQKRSNLAYNIHTIFGSNGAGAVGVQIMPGNILTLATPPGMEGINQNDVLEEGLIMATYFIPNKKRGALSRKIARETNTKPDISKVELPPISRADIALWNPLPSEMDNVSQAHTAHNKMESLEDIKSRLIAPRS